MGSLSGNKRVKIIVRALSLLLILAATAPSFSYAAWGNADLMGREIFSGSGSVAKVDGSSGALTERIAIDIPPGRNGMQPDIALEYNSQDTLDGIVGYGWSLSIPYIQRVNKTGTQNLYAATSTFSSSLEGELAAEIPGSPTSTYRAKIDDGSFNSYTFSNNTWTVYDKKGVRYVYGSSDAGRQFNAASSSAQTFKWVLQEIRDTNNNYVSFTYLKESNEIYPYEITYTGNASADGPFSVTFATSTRPDPIVSYRSAFNITTKHRISEIRAKIDGTTVRKYELNYGTGNNGVRSLLTSIQIKGYDDNNTEVWMPPYVMSYMSNAEAMYTPGNVSGPGKVFADANGDGLNDISEFRLGNPWPSTGTVNGSSIGTVPDAWANNAGTAQERGVRFVDINADGKPDVVTGKADQPPFYSLNQYSTSTSYAWSATSTDASIPNFARDSAGDTYSLGLIGEINGDGLADYVKRFEGFEGLEAQGIYFGNGSTWDSATTTLFNTATVLQTTPSHSTMQLFDMNGDGLDDIVRSDGSQIYVDLNNGLGWTNDSRWTIATSTMYDDPNSSSARDRGIRFFDINGDGLTDFVRWYNVTVTAPCSDLSYGEPGVNRTIFLNTGSGWATSTAYNLPNYIYQATCTASPSNWSVSTNEYGNFYGNGQHTQDVLSSITYPHGKKVSATYSRTAQSTSNPDLPFSILVANAIGVNDGRETIATTTYGYQGGKMDRTLGVREKKFAGFAKLTATSTDSVTVTHFNQDDGVNQPGEKTDDYALTNHPFKKEIYDLSGNLKQRTFYRWDTATHGSSTMALLTSEIEQLFATDGSSHDDMATEYQYASSTGDTLKKIEYGQVSSSASGTFTDTGSDARTIVRTYVASSSVNMSLPKEQTLLDYVAATSTHTKIFYDALSFGSVGNGNHTREERLVSSTEYASTTKTYNAYGLPTQTTDPRGNATTYTYESKNLYPATTTNPLTQSTGYLYNYSNGKPKLTIDSNSRVITNTFDGLGRVVETKQSDTTNSASLLAASTLTYIDSSTTTSSVLRKDYLTSTTTLDTYQYFDGFYRAIQERKQSDTAGAYAVSDNVYNGVGLIGTSSISYFSAGSSFTTPVATSSTTYSYDALKRPLTIADTNGTTSNAYFGWTRRTTDPNGNIKDYVQDGFGNLVAVVERISSSVATTSYTYNAQNNLATTTDALENVRAFTYDGLSRRISAQDLHAVGDGTFGSWSYAYDDAGNLTSQTDPKSQVVNRTYDALNRMLTEDYTGQAGTEVTNTYDSCTNGVGNLCIASSTIAKLTNSYDVLGRVSIATSTISGTEYVMRYSYDRKGNVTQMTYPNSATVSTYFSLFGLPSRVQRLAPGVATDSNIVHSFGHTPTGKVRYIDFGNNVESFYTYDPAKMYRLTNILTTAPGVGGEGLPEEGEITLPESNLDLLAQEAETTPEVFDMQSSSTEEGLFSTMTTAPPTIIEEETVDVATSTESDISTETSTTTPTEEVALSQEADSESLFEEQASSTLEEVLALVDEPATSTPRAVTSSIVEIIERSPVEQRANIKAAAIAKLGAIARTERPLYDIEVVSILPMNNGVQVFAKAWDENGAIGFGKDGSVEIERFRIINPPILVPDGTKRTIEVLGEEYEIDNFKEDPQEALFRVLEQIISVKQEKFGPGNIVAGRVGNTTSTFYPDPNAENTSVDGVVLHEEGSGASWSTVRDGAGTEAADSGAITHVTRIETRNNLWKNIHRSIFLFDTSSIPDTDTIASSTLSFYGHSKSNQSMSLDVNVYTSAPASNTSIVAGDYDSLSSDDLSTAISYANWSTSGYNNFALNATGTAAITKTGVTKLGTRNRQYDALNADPSPAASGDNDNGLRAYAADQTGTTNDPVLVVEHSAGGGGEEEGIALQDISYTYDPTGNITTITDSSATLAQKTTLFTYDSLNRLLSASTTAATSTHFRQAYDYNLLGNLLTKSDSTNAYSLDLERGSTQYASISDGSQTGLDITGAMTITAWIKFESFPANDEIWLVASKWNTTGDQRSYGFGYRQDGGSQGLFFEQNSNGQSGQNRNALVSWTPSTGVWYHVAVKYDPSLSQNSRVQLFINGSGTTPSESWGASTFNSSAEFQVGGAQNPTSQNFDGLIDDVRVWDRALLDSEIVNLYNDPVGTSNGSNLQGSWKFDNSYADVSSNVNTLTGQNSPVFSNDKAYGGSSAGSDSYTYAGTSYVNPHAPTSYFNGSATTTYTYDNNGNVTYAVSSATTTLYSWDYNNRLTSTAIGSGGSTTTTTFGYDYSGQRVSMAVGSTTTVYPSKYFSITSTTNGATTTATSTSYIFAGDTLVSYIEQALINGTATGTPSTYYVHPDHLGSTNVITSASGTVVMSKDYMPFGSTRVESGNATMARGYIGQFEDENLLYLQARYMDPMRGQFLSQDPIFLGDPKGQLLTDPQALNSARTMGGSNSGFASGWNRNTQSRGNSISQAEYLADPQMQNSYAYARGNPIRFKDPDGLWYKEFATGQQSWSSFQLELGGAANQLAQDSPTWGYAFDHPVRAGAAVGIGSGFAAYSAAGGVVVGAGFNATNAIVGGLNAYGWGQTTQSYLQYRATASQTARNQVIFDGLVSGASLLGTAQQKQALNILSAALTALSIELKGMSSGQSSGSSNSSSGSTQKKNP